MNSGSIEEEEKDNSNSEEKEEKEKIRPINIDYKMASRQKKLNILGIEIYFPYEPYENQILYMKKVIEALQTRGMAGLESPTGTGKTLCLLCACLGYLKHLREELIQDKNQKSENGQNKSEERIQPIIYYTSRTHAQISNVIKELRKTVYRPINAVISSRDQSCVNDYINHYSGGILNLKCKYAKMKRECKYNRISENKSQGWSAYDGLTVDELKVKAKMYKFCPYFFEKDKSKHADIVFLPYNYIFDMKICSRSNFNLTNSILIIDEAHNLQDICCDSASVDINTNVLEEIINDLKSVEIYYEELESFGGRPPGGSVDNYNIKTKDLKNEIYILNILKERIINFKLENKNFQKGQNPGIKLDTKSFFDLLFKSYKSNQISIQNFNFIQTNQTNQSENDNNKEKENSEKENSEDIEPELNWKNITKHISFLKIVEEFINNDRGKGTLISIYVDFLTVLNLISENYFKNNSENEPLKLYVNSFRFYIEEETEIKNDSNKKNKKKFQFSNNKVTKRILHIFCFNPGIGFKEVMKNKFISTIITSGTLAPIDSMESELKYNFDYKLENTHVIDDSQFNFCVLSSSPDKDIEFNFNKDNRTNENMILELGNIIAKLCEITPGGILVFFSSYYIMEEYIKEWTEKSIISEITKHKEFYQDRRDSKENKKILEKYEKANSNRTNNKGAILLSVCRGSCSEGMNFKDNMARLVIVVGIPYAMLYDAKVQLKKEFQDEFNKLLYKDEKYRNIKKLSGSEWYSQNALKCVNQALGRVIRHANDYGAMLLIDSRYTYIVKKNYISLWMRNKCNIYNKFNKKNFYNDMKNFFEKAENFIKNKKLKNQNAQLNKKDDDLSDNNLSKKSIEKKSKVLKDKLNEFEKNKLGENTQKFIIYRSKKIKINEIKIGDNNKKQDENKEENIQEKNLEGINNIDESFFNNLLSEENISKKCEKELFIEEEKEEDIYNKKLIDELVKKKNDPKFLEQLEKSKFQMHENNENNEFETENKNILTCKICYLNTDDSKTKIEVAKCGHTACQNCWKKLEDKNGNALCPICRKKVKKKDRNLVYLN